MKKNLLAAISLGLAALFFSIASVLWVQNTRYKLEIVTLTHRVEDLQDQLSALSGHPAALTIGDTSLTAHLRNDGQAVVSFTLTPADATDADAFLKILAEDTLITRERCRWDGESYSAQAELMPLNGCTYILDLGGTEYVLASPANGACPDLVNLADSLSAYCNMILGDWIVESGRLTLDSCHLQVQAPRLGTVTLPASQEVRILLKHRGDLVEGAAVILEQGEGAASYEGILTGLSLSMPDLEAGSQVDLWMEATLADGQMVSVCAANWTRDAMGWTMAAG